MSASAPLVYRYGRRLAPGAPVTAVHWLGDEAWYALGDGTVWVAPKAGDARVMPAHKGAILCAAPAPHGRALLTGGDDGRLLRVDAEGAVTELGAFGRLWVEHVVSSRASGVIAATAGKETIVWKPGSTTPSHRVTAPSTVGGLALDAKGKRLALTHYGGATLTFAMSAGGSCQQLRWDGSHLACTLSPDGGYLVTAMQETGLHGWKLPLGGDMRMSGYQAKTRSFAWDRRGRELATSGDVKVVIWPFTGPTGPMGKRPRLAAARETVVTQVAFNPKHDMLAVGYADGAVALSRPDDDMGALIDEPGGAEVTALSWSEAGDWLAWGDADGGGGVMDFNKRAAA